MSKPRTEFKVGVFVLIGLALLAALLIQFSKGVTMFRQTYVIYLKASNVGGLKPKAAVLMSGVQVGSVTDIRLAPDGKSVTISLRLFKDYQIHKDAQFIIDQAGFLGDQYVAIQPTKNVEPPFKDQDRAEAEAPFNLQEFTRSATGFIQRIDETVKKLDEALDNVTRLALSPETLTNLSITVANLREFSDRALLVADNVNGVLTTNTPAINAAATNLVAFSKQLSEFATGLQGVLDTNRDSIHVAVDNIESSSETLKSLLTDVQAGKGLAGELLKNEQIATNISGIAQNLSITTSNLNRLGFWRILWQHKPAKPEPAPARQIKTPKDLTR
ncbi:MAG TPA: MlaD family protein [Patescibacteria group bacterium]|jgi:phospholipid/cholesterol/gamma-HCH transport system substrate-binding protein|nr:MlaD family protein [Patescibacteria group bacterium]